MTDEVRPLGFAAAYFVHLMLIPIECPILPSRTFLVDVEARSSLVQIPLLIEFLTTLIKHSMD